MPTEDRIEVGDGKYVVILRSDRASQKVRQGISSGIPNSLEYLLACEVRRLRAELDAARAEGPAPPGGGVPDHSSVGFCAEAQSPSPTDGPVLRDGGAAWQLRVEAGRLSKQLEGVRKQIRALERERALQALNRLPPQQRRVLAAFMDEGGGGWGDELCFGFRTVAEWTGLTRTQVSRACKALRRYGFLSFHRGLFTEDGVAAGSGYGLTEAGRKWWQAREAAPEDVTQPSQPSDGEGEWPSGQKPTEHNPLTKGADHG